MDVIEFLEMMGKDAQWRHAPGDDVAQALSDAGITAELQSAVLVRDMARLEALLGQTPCAGYFLPGKEEEEEEGEGEGDDEDAPTRQPDEAIERNTLPGMIA